MFNEIDFDKDLVGFGSGSGPGHNTLITETDDAGEERVARSDTPRHRFRLRVIDRTNEEIADIRRFVIGQQGALLGFRVKDPNDFTTALDGVSQPSNTDVQIGTGDGSTTQFQLVKKYTSGLSTITRTINKPTDAAEVTGANAVTVAVNGVAQTEGADYSVDYTTGLVTFVAPPTAGHAITVGFEFRVPVRFSKDVDEWLATTREEPDQNTISSLEMVELVSPVGVNINRNYGGHKEREMTGDLTLALTIAQLYVLSAETAGFAALLPDPADLPTGPDLWVVMNVGAEDIDIKDHLENTLLTLATGEGTHIHLSTNGVGGFVWYAA